MATYAVIITAAGGSDRFGKGDKKQFTKIDNRPLFIRAIECFVNREDVCQMILVVAPEDLDMVKERYSANLGFMGVTLVEGGTLRWASVKNALAHVKDGAEYVAVHDAARVCVTQDMIDKVFAAAVDHQAAVLGAPLTGTIKSVGADGVIQETVPRRGLYEAQTPQVFEKTILLRAYESVAEDTSATDDAEIVEQGGTAVTVVESDMSNLKITYKGDVALAAAILKSRPKRKAGPLAAFEEAQW